MSDDWIKMRISLPDHPRIVQLAGALQIDRDAIVGKLLRLWGYFDKHTTDGNATGVTYAFIDELCRQENFAENLEKVGWVSCKNDTIRLVRFDEHNSQTAKRRAVTAKRVRKNRNVKCNAGSVTRALPEKEKEKEYNNPPVSPKPKTETTVEIPAELKAKPGFDQAWSDWQQHRRETNHTLKPTTMKSQLKMLAKQPNPVAVIEQSILNGWQGLFPDKSGGNNGNGTNRQSTGRSFAAAATQDDKFANRGEPLDNSPI